MRVGEADSHILSANGGPMRLRLFVVRGQPTSEAAIDVLKRMRARSPGLIGELTVIDLAAAPELAVKHDIVGTPTLDRLHPGPTRRIVGVPDDPGAILESIAPFRERADEPGRANGTSQTRGHASIVAKDALLDASRSGLAVLDAQLTFRYVNRRLADLLGSSASALLEMPLEQTVHPDDRTLLREHIKRVLGTAAPIETRLMCDGEPVPVRLELFTLDVGPEPLVGLVCTDTRELERLREHMVEAASRENRILADANARLEQANRAKDAFLASMSHELRTPLNSIIGFTGVLLQGLAGELNEEQVRQLEMVNHSGRHLLGLIQDILDLSKLTSETVDLAFETVDPCAIARSVTDGSRQAADQRGLALKLDEPCSAGSMVTDKRRLEQILINLTSNAIKYTEKGSIELSVSARGHRYVCFTVTDTGVGIPDDSLRTIFDEFTQLNAMGKAKTEGTGLGLAVCRRLAELLGGWLEVESAVGQGSSFALILPRKPPGSDGGPDEPRGE